MTLPELSVAAREGNEEKLGQLLKIGHDCSVRDYAGITAFQEAAENGHLQCVKLLVSAARASNHACSTRDLMQIMCPSSAEDGDSFQKTPLYLSARHGHWQIVEFLTDLYMDATPHETGFALHAACMFKQHKCIRILAHRLPQLLNSVKTLRWHDDYNFFPIHLSAQMGDFDGYKILVDAGANVRVTGFRKTSLLEYACMGKNPDLVLRVLQSTGDVNYVDEKGFTALHIAAGKENGDIVKLLLEYGADPDITCNLIGYRYINCPLSIAVSGHDFKCVKLLANVTKNPGHQINAVVSAGLNRKCDYVSYLFKIGYPTFPSVFDDDASWSGAWSSILTENQDKDISTLIALFLNHGNHFPNCKMLFSSDSLYRMHVHTMKTFFRLWVD